MGAAAAIVAAQRARLEREFVNHLREHKALSRETAALLRPQRWIGRRALLALVAEGSIVSVGEDMYWLNEAAYAVAQKRRQARKILVLLVAAILLVAAMALAVLKAAG
ncbi:MAG TPA: hypothetical protein VG942_18320 [Hyphomonadaceae bacterium]|nr:hypothetical protein [Hyphomonadaceae bacterium]